LRQYEATKLAVSSLKFLAAEEKHMEIKGDKNEWKKV
jgi:hypothetical protein